MSAPFTRVMCAVTSGPESDVAVLQAARLAGSWSPMEIVAVSGWGESPLGASLPRDEADAALDRARALGNGVAGRAGARQLHGGDPVAALARELEPSDLLVVGSHGGSRAHGAALGTVPAGLMHRPPCSVLVARRTPEGETFPERILAATDGSPASRHAVEVAAGIARREDSKLTLVHVAGHDHPAQRRELAEETVAVFEEVGMEPVLVLREGRAHREIVGLAAQERFSLVALGRRGLGGVRALGSVSERVGHDADASVLIVPPR